MTNPLDNFFSRDSSLINHLCYTHMESKLGGVLARAEMSKVAGVEWVKGHFREGKFVSSYRRQSENKSKEFAPGLPVKGNITSLPKIEEGSGRIWELAVQDHTAVKAGRHLDLRLGDPRTGVAHSWAIPKAILPAPGEHLLAIRQGDHTIPYMDYKGVLAEGYGKGTVKLQERGRTEITYSDPDLIKFNIYRGKDSSEYILRRTGGPTKWLLQNVTATRERRPDLPSSKPPYKEMKPEKVDFNRDNEIVQAKVDGAHVLLSLKPGKQTRIFSYRPTERDTGIIEYTHKVPGIIGHRASKETGDTILRGEVYAVDRKGQAIPAQDIGGMLNAGVWKSRELQEEKGHLTTALFDVVKHKGKPAEQLGYTEKLRILREIAGREKVFHLPDTAENPIEKRKLFDAIKEGRNPQTKEGVIVWDKDKPFPTKAKHRPDFDVYVQDVFPAYGKDGKELDRAGGFTYSWHPDSPAIGRVGTGFSHELLRDMKAYPDRYKGRVAKVLSLEKMRGKGALRAPSFSDWHLEKGKQAGIGMAILNILLKRKNTDKRKRANVEAKEFGLNEKDYQEALGDQLPTNKSSKKRRKKIERMALLYKARADIPETQPNLEPHTAQRSYDSTSTEHGMVVEKGAAAANNKKVFKLDAGQRKTLADKIGKSFLEAGKLEDTSDKEKTSGLTKKTDKFSPQVKQLAVTDIGGLKQKIIGKLHRDQGVGKFQGMFNPEKVPKPVDFSKLAPVGHE